MARWIVLLVLLATALRASAAPQKGMGGPYLHYLNLDGGRSLTKDTMPVSRMLGSFCACMYTRVFQKYMFPWRSPRSGSPEFLIVKHSGLLSFVCFLKHTTVDFPYRFNVGGEI